MESKDLKNLSKEDKVKYKLALFALKSHRIIVNGDKKVFDTNPEGLIKYLNLPIIQVLDILTKYIEKDQIIHQHKKGQPFKVLTDEHHTPKNTRTPSATT